jgi:hypothetical protein
MLSASEAVTRRTLLQRGGLAVGAAATSGLLFPSGVGAHARMPGSRRRPVANASRIDRSRFASVRELTARVGALDDLGLRATGSAVHHRYADSLAARLQDGGVTAVTTEGVPMKLWEPTSWNLEVVGGIGAGPVPVAAYVPYSGMTPADGVTGPLSLLTLGTGINSDAVPPVAPGTIGLVEVKGTPLTTGAFDAVDYGAPGEPHHRPGYSPTIPYDRAWLDQGNVESVLQAYQGKGLAGLVFILDLPAAAARGMYMPYHGVLYDTPAVFVDRDTGAALERVALGGGHARLVLDASVRHISTPNVYGYIPGATEELVILESHHDGTNGVEENGCEAIVAIGRYLASVERCALPRSVLLLCATGHFAGNALGCTTFIERHKDDLVARTAAAVSIEHLGALEWLPDASGNYAKTGQYEFGGFFSAPFDAVIDPCRASLAQAAVTEDRVMRPFSTGSSPDGLIWPGDGQPLWAIAGLPSANFITGPAYLLNGGMRVFDLIDMHAFRRQAIAFGDLLLALTRAPLEALQKRRPDDPRLGPSDTSPGSTAAPAVCKAKRHKRKARHRRRHSAVDHRRGEKR